MPIDFSQVKTITIPEGDVKRITIAGVVVWESKVLTSITLSGQTTSLDREASFSFGGTVIANYSDGSTADVTSSTTFSGYNMSTAGTYTVTASYTEDGVTKTATYSLTVNKVWSTIWSGTKDFYFNRPSGFYSTWTKTGAGQITTAGKTSSKQLRITFSSYTTGCSFSTSYSAGIWWKGKSAGTHETSFGSSPKSVTISSWGSDIIYATAAWGAGTYTVSFSIYTSSSGAIGVWMGSVPTDTSSYTTALKFGMKITKIEEYY